MQIIDSMEQLHIEEDTAVAIGKFDGIHRGHKALLQEILDAKKHGLKAVVFTFYPLPTVVFGQGKVGTQPFDRRFQSLSTRAEKRRYLEEAGIDYLVEYPLNLTTAAIEPVEYITSILVERMHVKLIVAGPDLSFGKQGKGDFALLRQYAEKYHYEARQIEKVGIGGREISSTRVRESVEQGDMKAARVYLGSWYCVEGIVRHGTEIGRTLGFPTLNLVPEKEKLLPPFGVYHSQVEIEGTMYQAVTNVGRKPTVHDGEEVTVETFVFHYQGQAYGLLVRVELMEYARPEQKFAGKEQLMEQIRQDVERAEKYFGFTGHP
ncbi:MAG: riboflavin biosynthesis protein RibF [Lachnospiraceae bacterium]|nr:riboflavin biosynthesis protein RibF [Lachnospiraceae bacterium]